MVQLFIILRGTSFTGIMWNFFKHAPFSFDRLWQFREQIGMFENLKMAAPLVVILAPETSYYLVVINNSSLLLQSFYRPSGPKG